MDDILDALAADKWRVDDATSSCNDVVQSLFSVQLQFANADKEMKRIFGVGPRSSLDWSIRFLAVQCG